jgi:hypothetical protein
MAPEQWRGGEADTGTDLWAIGAILYRLLANVSPFDAASLTALSARVLSGEPATPLAQLCPGAPREVCELVDRLLRFERDERPSNVGEVIDVLDGALRTLELGHAGGALTPRRAAGEPMFAQGSGPESPTRYWDKVLVALVPGEDSPAFPERLPAWLMHGAQVGFEVVRCAPTQGTDDEAVAKLRASLLERFKRLRHMFFVAHGHGARVVLRMLLDDARRLHRSGGIGLDARSPFYRTRHIAILGPAGDTAVLAAELAAEASVFAELNLPVPVIRYLDADELHGQSPALKQLTAALVRPELVLAQETIAQTFELDCAARTLSLVAPVDGADDARDQIANTVPGADGGTQREIFDDVLAFARAQHARPAVMVVAGDAGVGKSTVLRMAARRLCLELASAGDGDAVLPILVPLYFASLSAERLAALDAETAQDKRGRVLHDVVLDWWCRWMNDVTYADAMAVDWLTARLRTDAIVMIFDGVDEFITNHPTISISDFQQMLAFIATEYRHNSWLASVIGVRSTQPGIPLLASSNVREVLRLTAAQAARQFPATEAWLGSASDASIKQLLSTPLILAQLNIRRAPSSLKATTPGDVVMLALTTIIEQSDLSGKLDARGRPIDAQCWIDALMAVAWCLYRRLRGEISIAALRLDGAELHRAWAAHLEATGQQAEGERLLAGLHLLREGRAFDALLQRTVLYPTGRGEVRFIHREWQDFLAARYLAQVVMYRKVDELKHVGNTARIARIAGDILDQAGVHIDEAFVRTLLAQAAELTAPNFAALITNSKVLIEGPAIDAFLSAIHTMAPVARLITLIGLGYRALRGDDASAPDLRYYLARVFRGYRDAGDDHGVMRSVAWCYRKAYAQRFSSAAVADPWPGLPGLDDGAERDALAMMCSTDDGGPRFRAEHRSVQTALLEVQQVVAGDPFRPISGVHYLYCLCVARHHGAGIAELGRALPALLAPGSAYAQAIEGYRAVPELALILQECRRLAVDS